MDKWKLIEASKDPKDLWKKIDWKGELNNKSIETSSNVNEFAEVLEKRLPKEDTFYDDINTNIFNPITDSKITDSEVLSSVHKIKKNSSSKCGIPIQLLLFVIPFIVNMLSSVFNSIFVGENDKYPSIWKAMMKCLPKKGKLDMLNFRAIGMKPLLAKVYDFILLRRLMAWFKIPVEQTAYQKGKGCYMHVFFVRCIIAIVIKKKKQLYIGISDFAAAFDSISRRRLFQKLVHLGIGAFMLNALKEMYKNACVLVEFDGEYSYEFELTAGVLQGSATSTVLFIAYTADLINLFKRVFGEEDIIHMYHLLVHADDAIILATKKSILKEKFCTLENYCFENKISLQPKKCSFICINSHEKEPIDIKSGTIKYSSETVYLGSMITDQGNINYDIKHEIKGKEKAFNKFFAFLHKNCNAPLVG